MEAAWNAGEVIFLAGEPGVGKTRLALEFGVEFGDYLVSKTTSTDPLPGGLRWIHTFRPAEMPAEWAQQVESGGDRGPHRGPSAR
ncbi:MAG: hypothetical protein QN163_03640 [Armatimonadota bacterium]|nr:hypothetical protein [Armatimonadota bacterium]MDR5697349.1 hypothetical protein [Armatimonadota bacterium]